MKIATHNGSFHTDDAFAVAVLLTVYPEAQVIRTRDKEEIESADIAVDVGGEHDPKRMRFDHHQEGGAGERENGIPYASFGLAWKEFGEKISGSLEAAAIIDEKLASPIDALDNGVEVSESIFEGVREYGVGDYLNSYVRGDETLEELDELFIKIAHEAKGILEREVRIARKKSEDWQKAREVYDNADDKEVVVLPGFMSWKRVLIPTEAKFVVSRRSDDRWQARGVPLELGSFEVKKPFPAEWGAKSGEDLEKITGVVGAFFCHAKLWLTVARTKEGAIELAKKALEA